MRTRSALLPLLAVLALVAAACGGGQSTAPSTEPSSAPSVAPSAEASPSTGPSSDLKIGVVTDVGTVNDKNFNEFTYVGAQNGAKAIGAAEPPYAVPTSASEYATLIQAYIDQKFGVIVATGFNLVPATAAAAKANPDIWFIGVDHAPCINGSGDIDPTFSDCSGDVATLLPKYIALNYAEDQAGYLAGIVAAKASKTGTIGAIGGVSLCAPCVRYIQGYIAGAKATMADVKVKIAWVSDSDFVKGFDQLV